MPGQEFKILDYMDRKHNLFLEPAAVGAASSAMRSTPKVGGDSCHGRWRNMRIIIFTSLLFLCVGCRHGYLVTDQAPFASYVGHDLTLKRSAVLCEGPWFEIGPPYMHDASFTNSVEFRAGVRRADIRLVATLPSGTVVRLDKVNFAWDEEAGAGSFIAWGKTALPDTRNELGFTYFWGMVDSIDRAPWDDDSVPSHRSAHFEPR